MTDHDYEQLRIVVLSQVGRFVRNLKSFHDREDLIQDGWVAAMEAVEKIGVPRTEAEFRYVHSFVRTELIDRIRYLCTRNRRQPEDPGDAEPSDVNREIEHLEDEEQAAKMLESTGLTDKQRAILEDVYWNDMSYADIARRDDSYASNACQLHDRTILKIRRNFGIPDPAIKPRRPKKRPTAAEWAEIQVAQAARKASQSA